GGELVIANQRGDSDEEAGRRRDEGCRDAGCDRAQGSRARGAQTVEGVHDAHDRAEEADEGRGAGDGGEPRHALLHVGEGLGAGGERGAFERGWIAGQTAPAGLALVFVVDLDEDRDQRTGLELFRYGRDLRQPARLAESTEEACTLLAGAREGPPFGQHDGPREEAEEQQDDEDDLSDCAGVAHGLEQRGAWRANRNVDAAGDGVVLQQEKGEREGGGQDQRSHYGYCRTQDGAETVEGIAGGTGFCMVSPYNSAHEKDSWDYV